MHWIDGKAVGSIHHGQLEEKAQPEPEQSAPGSPPAPAGKPKRGATVTSEDVST